MFWWLDLSIAARRLWVVHATHGRRKQSAGTLVTVKAAHEQTDRDTYHVRGV